MRPGYRARTSRATEVRSARAWAGVTPGFMRPKALIMRRLRLAMKRRVGTERARRGGHVDVVLVGILRDRRQHADHDVRPVVHLVLLADDVGIAALLPFPELVAQDQDGLRAGLLFLFGEPPAQDRLDAQVVEEVVPRRRRCAPGAARSPPSSVKVME